MADNERERLRRLYVDERMSPKRIADELGVHYSTVYRRLNRYGIEREDPVRLNTIGEGYEEVVTPGGEKSYVHRLVAVAEYGFDVVAGNDIHHSNGVSWDNRPSNVEVVDHAEHTKRHKSGLDQARDEAGNFA